MATIVPETAKTSMMRKLENIGCISAIVVFLVGVTAALTTTSNGRVILGILFVIVGLLIIVCIPHNLRIWRARRAFKSLPATIKEQVIKLIEETATENPTITYLLLEDKPCSEPEIAVLSHVGGMPYAESGETWPIHRYSVPPRFLLQVRLDEPSLGEQWQGRLIVIFFIFDAEQIVRSYADPSLEKYVPIASAVPPFNCVHLTSVPFPVASKHDPIPMSPVELCENIPELRDLLGPFTDDCSGVLSQILRPDVYKYDLEAPDIAYQGGSPMLIQNPHNPECDHCNQIMRFLFQFGEIIPGLQMADAGVGYVYGCDDHPHHCKAVIDSH